MKVAALRKRMVREAEEVVVLCLEARGTFSLPKWAPTLVLRLWLWLWLLVV